MNDVFYGHLSDTERELAIYESKFNIDMKKAELMSIYAERMNEIKEMEAELRVLTEGGTYDDLVAYYEAEAEANNEQKGNAIQAFIKAIGDFISGIINSITNIFKKPDEKAKEDAVNKANGKITVVNFKEAVFKHIDNGLNRFKNTFSKEPTEQEAEQTGASIDQMINLAEEAYDKASPVINMVNAGAFTLTACAKLNEGLKYWKANIPTVTIPISNAATFVKDAFTSSLSSLGKLSETLVSVMRPKNEKAAAIYDNIIAKIKAFFGKIKDAGTFVAELVNNIFDKIKGQKKDGEATDAQGADNTDNGAVDDQNANGASDTGANNGSEQKTEEPKQNTSEQKPAEQPKPAEQNNSKPADQNKPAANKTQPAAGNTQQNNGETPAQKIQGLEAEKKKLEDYVAELNNATSAEDKAANKQQQKITQNRIAAIDKEIAALKNQK